MEKKYEIMDNEKLTIIINIGRHEEVHTLHPIRAMKNFSDVKKGDLGGYIENENNLSQDDYCWVYDYAMVFGNASVSENAKIRDYSMVYGNATIGGTAVLSYNSRVFDSAMIRGTTRVMNNAMVFGDAYLTGEVAVIDNAIVFGKTTVINHSIIKDSAVVGGDSHIYGTAIISGNSRVFDEFIGCDSKITSTPKFRIKREWSFNVDDRSKFLSST